MNGCWDEFWLRESFHQFKTVLQQLVWKRQQEEKNLLEHFGLFVDQQGVAGVADSQRLRRTGKFHLVVTATITEDASAIPEIMNYF